MAVVTVMGTMVRVSITQAAWTRTASKTGIPEGGTVTMDRVRIAGCTDQSAANYDADCY